MAIQTLYPNQKPSLLLDFANVKALDPRITFTRTTTATYYNGVTTAKAEENLLLRSQAFLNDWVVTAITLTANSTTAPDGTSTAFTFAGNGATTTHFISQGSVASSVGKTVSIFAKANTNNFIQIHFAGDSAPWANFDLTAGSGAVGSTGTNQTASIVDEGNGWYRCIIITPSSSATDVRITLVSSSTAARFESNSLSTSVFIWGAQCEFRQSVTAYTPTTTQPITNYIPVLLTAASGVARFDHNPTTGESLGLLVEEQRTNLLERSAEFDNAYWSQSNSSITANTIVAPDGTLTGDKLVENTTSNAHNTFRQVTGCVNGTPYTFSVYVKAGGRSAIQMAQRDSGFAFIVAATFNIDTQVITVTTGSPTTSITSVGNGWYKCSITGNANGTTVGVLVALSNGSITNYTGDGYSGTYIWGAQLEEGAFPTSYIPTVAATVTRNADAASMTGTNFSSWFNAAEGAVYCEAATVSLAVNRGTWAIGNNSLGFGSSNVIYEIYTASLSGRRTLNVLYNGSDQVNTLSPAATQTVNTFSKSAGVYKVNDYAFTTNAASPQTDTAALVPQGVTGLSIGSLTSGWSGATNYLNGTIRKIAFYPSRLSNAQLIALTS